MQLILANSVDAKVLKRSVNCNSRFSFYFSFDVETPKENNGDDDENYAANKLISEITEGNRCILRVIMSPLNDGHYEVMLRSSMRSFNVLKKLRERFGDSVMISLEISSVSFLNVLYSSDDDSSEDEAMEADNDNDELSMCCLSSTGMRINKANSCKAHSRYIQSFKLPELKRTSSFHVKVTAHIDNFDLIHRNKCLSMKTTEKILEDGVASDVTITAGNGVEIKSHKCFLVSKSSVLQRMLEGGMMESQDGQIDMTDISEEGVRAFLRFLYLGKVPETMDIDLAYNLLYAAHKYDVPKLEEIVKTNLLERDDDDIEVNQAFKMYSFVRGIKSSSELKDKFVGIMLGQFEELKKSPEFQEVFKKNPADAIEICGNFVKVRINSPPKRKMVSENIKATSKKPKKATKLCHSRFLLDSDTD